MGILNIILGVILALSCIFVNAVSICYLPFSLAFIAMGITILREMPDIYEDASIFLEE